MGAIHIARIDTISEKLESVSRLFSEFLVTEIPLSHSNEVLRLLGEELMIGMNIDGSDFDQFISHVDLAINELKYSKLNHPGRQTLLFEFVEGKRIIQTMTEDIDWTKSVLWVT